MKKTFTDIDTGRIYQTIETATAKKGQQGTASQEEAAERSERLQTQGRKGCKAVRINMAFTPANYDFIKTVSGVVGQTMTAYVNSIIAKYREEHADIYEKAADVKKML